MLAPAALLFDFAAGNFGPASGCLGGDPESSLILCTAPDFPGRLKALRERGGKLVVIDPRLTRTAKIADEHHFVRPGSDALLLCALVNVVHSEGLDEPGRLADHVAARYAAWDGELGCEILEAERDLEGLAELALDRGLDPQPVSGRQEALENLVNRYR